MQIGSCKVEKKKMKELLLYSFMSLYIQFSIVESLDGVCSRTTISDYCPSSCQVETSVRAFHNDTQRQIGRHRERLRNVRMIMDSGVHEQVPDIVFKANLLAGSMMLPEQKKLKKLVDELERNASKHRQDMRELMKKTNEQENKITSLFQELEYLAENCQETCVVEESTDPVRISRHECVGELCRRAARSQPIVSCMVFDQIEGNSCGHLYTLGYRVNGIYRIRPIPTLDSFQVYCEMAGEDGGWTVIQRRSDGSVDFNRSWEEYKLGFGNVSCDGEFWLGNEHLSSIGHQDYQTARFVVKDWNDEIRVAQYTYFKVNEESHSYTLQISDYQKQNGENLISNASDAMAPYNERPFSTYDRNKLPSSAVPNCPSQMGGWWHMECNLVNLNGIYHRGVYNHPTGPEGVMWSDRYSLKSSEIKLKPYNLTPG